MKALVFQARSALIEDRRARGMPCVESRELLATATAGELRRRSVRRHLRQCEGCAQFREDVRDQRRLLALALHVVPSPGLKESTLAAAGVRRGGVAGDGALLAALGARGPVAAIGAAVVAPSLGWRRPLSSWSKPQAAVEWCAHEAWRRPWGLLRGSGRAASPSVFGEPTRRIGSKSYSCQAVAVPAQWPQELR